MVAYSFNKQFEMPILTLRKMGTIRAKGNRRHGRVGAELQLYTGMRTKACRLIARATCVACDPITVDFATGAIVVWAGGTNRVLDDDAEAFAQSDGFESFEAMARFWRDTHGADAITDSVWIRWGPQSLRPAGS